MTIGIVAKIIEESTKRTIKLNARRRRSLLKGNKKVALIPCKYNVRYKVKAER